MCSLLEKEDNEDCLYYLGLVMINLCQYVKPCKQLMKNSSLIDAVDKIVKDVHHTESVITVFTHVSLSLRQGWKYSHELQQLESDPIHTFGEAPKRDRKSVV